MRNVAWMGAVDRGFVNDFSVYAGYIGFTRDGRTDTYADPLAGNVNQPGAAEGPGFRHQTYEPVPLGYAITPPDTDSQLSASPVWSVDQIEWERLGGRTAGTTTADQVTLGELAIGRGVVRIVGALLPMPTEQYYHPFGLANYALTYSGYQVFQNALQWERPLPDLAIAASDIALSSQKVVGGDHVTISATVHNIGAADAASVAVRFTDNGSQIGAVQTIASIVAGGAGTAQVTWDTKGLKGGHVIAVSADPAGRIAEIDESNNTASGTVTVRGNKVRNGSFEQSSSGSSPDNWSASGDTSYGAGGTDGQKAASAGPGGTWTSEAIEVTPDTTVGLSRGDRGGGHVRRRADRRGGPGPRRPPHAPGDGRCRDHARTPARRHRRPDPPRRRPARHDHLRRRPPLGGVITMRHIAVLAATIALLGGLLPIAHVARVARAADSPVFYFHGEAADEANSAFLFDGRPGTAVFDETPPTELVPDSQSTTPVANQDFVGNPLAAYWRGAYTPAAPIEGLLELTWFWSSSNPAAVASGTQVTVTVFGNPDYDAPSPVQPDRIIGRGVVTLALGAAPTENRGAVTVDSGSTPITELLIQAAATSIVTGDELRVHYAAVSTPSRFFVRDVPLPPPPTVVHDSGTALEFAPGTVVSAHFLGAEPMTVLERPVAASLPGAVDPDRVFVDWPLSTRSQVGQLSRSEDGADSFRLLYDRTCAPRSRPMCTTGGGGDTNSEVNLVTGTVLFADQVGLANEALASSTDHGDSFPLTRAFTVTNATTGTDRQWLTWIAPSIASTVAGSRLEGFLAYHLPAAGQYIQGIDAAGAPVPQAVPQILDVSQSGPIRVDNTAGPGRGWIYQPYRNGGGYRIATARAADYQDPGAWRTFHVTSDQPAIFPWLQLDERGNAYAVWVTAGVVFLSVSPIDDPRNDPGAGGRPGTYWQQVRVTPPEITSAVFPVVAGGDPGRVAIAYMGSTDCRPGVSDGCAVTTHWDTYAAVLDDALALARGETARVVTGKVNHRTAHRGSVCTGGTTCTGDRSLLDMIDVGFDAAGRVGVVFMDNNNRLAAPNETDNAKGGPFVLFAKQVAGPSLSAASPTVAVAIARDGRADPPGDATWPNAVSATNLPALDLGGAEVFVSGEDLVARLQVADTAVGGARRDLAAYNGVAQTNPPAERLQHVVRFAAGFDVFHLSMETLPDGTRRFFGGRIDANDGLPNPTSPTAFVAAGYHTDAVPVSGIAAGGTITLRAKAADFGLAAGSELFSVSGFAFAGPTEAHELTAANPMRTVDATPPFDETLAERPTETTAIDCADPAVTRTGGWHVLDDARVGEGTLCRVITKADGGAASLELRFDGSAVDVVVVAKGPRGGLLDLLIDGAQRPASIFTAPRPTRRSPTNSGRKDLDFGVVIHLEAESNGPHTLRIAAAPGPAGGDTKRDMAYVDGFLVTGESLLPSPGAASDESTLTTGELATAVQQLFNVAADAATTQLTIVLESAPGAVLEVVAPTSGSVLARATADDGVAVVRLTPDGPANYAVVVSASPKTPFLAWTVHGKAR